MLDDLGGGTCLVVGQEPKSEARTPLGGRTPLRTLSLRTGELT